MRQIKWELGAREHPGSHLAMKFSTANKHFTCWGWHSRKAQILLKRNTCLFEFRKMYKKWAPNSILPENCLSSFVFEIKIPDDQHDRANFKQNTSGNTRKLLNRRGKAIAFSKGNQTPPLHSEFPSLFWLEMRPRGNVRSHCDLGVSRSVDGTPRQLRCRAGPGRADLLWMQARGKKQPLSARLVHYKTEFCSHHILPLRTPPFPAPGHCSLGTKWPRTLSGACRVVN